MKYFRLNKLRMCNINIHNISPKLRVVLLFFVVLPAMAILGAGIINKLIVVPYLSEQARASATDVVIPSGKAYSFYLLQAGVFSNKDNAEMLASQITSAGFKAISIKDGEVYRVVAAATDEKNSLEEYDTKLKQSGYITLCKAFEADETSLSGMSKEEREYITAAGELINTMLEYSSNGQKLDKHNIELLEAYTSAVRKQYDIIKNKAGEKAEAFNSFLLESSEEYPKQGDNMDKQVKLAWECIVGYGNMVEEMKK